jgi:alkanesulfonate monooxygenase SsuD/methylene tetrahydromethanopterin reductase-like flavin-dependent oxidoreductase (luciferase family)
MKSGLSVPIFDQLADPRLLAQLAVEAEAAGWDGVFLWDHLRYRAPAQAATDPWITLAAIATATERILLGPMVTPLARRRPQVVARQLVALDHLCAGRVIFGAGLGMDTSGEEFVRFGEETDARRRAEMLDEALDVLTSLLAGDEVNHHGPHYEVDGIRFLPTPVNGRLPIWIAARSPNRRPLQRAARYDGVFVIDVTPVDLPDLIAVVDAARPSGLADFEVVVHDVAGVDPRPWQQAGATWLLTTFDAFTATPDEVRAAIANGPPTHGP